MTSGLGGVEARDQGQAGAAAHAGVEPTGQPEAVEQREAAHHDVLGAELHERLGAGGGIAGHVAVGQLGTLGLTGGAGGVEQHHRLVVLPVDDLVIGLEPAEQVGEPLRVDADALDADLGRGLGGLLGHLVPGEDDRGTGVLEVVLHLAGLEQRVHRHHDGAEAEDAVVGHGEIGDVGQHQADAVAGLDAAIGKQTGHARAGGIEPRVGHLDVVQLHRGAIAVTARRLGEEGGQVRAHVSPRLVVRRCSRYTRRQPKEVSRRPLSGAPSARGPRREGAAPARSAPGGEGRTAPATAPSSRPSA